MQQPKHDPTSRYAEGLVRAWDLELRQWRQTQRQRHGCAPDLKAELEFFATVSTMDKWVPDPDFGQPVSMTHAEIAEIEQALSANRNLLRQFKQFLQRHEPTTEDLY